MAREFTRSKRHRACLALDEENDDRLPSSTFKTGDGKSLVCTRPGTTCLIQAWIECILRHIEEIIRLKGGNEYEERHEAFQRNTKARLKGNYLHALT
jgi:hypothetical protein